MAIPQPKRITELDLASPLTDADQIAIVQDNRTKRATLSQVTSLFSGCQCTLFSRYNSVGNGANTVVNYLQTYSMPGNTVPTDGSWVDLYAAGTFAANGNTKIANIGIASNSTGLNISLGTTSSTFNDVTWNIHIRLQRAGSDAYTYSSRAEVFSNGASMSAPSVYIATVNTSGWAGLWANDIQLSVTGQTGTATANNVIVNQFIGVLHLLDVNS